MQMKVTPFGEDQQHGPKCDSLANASMDKVLQIGAEQKPRPSIFQKHRVKIVLGVILLSAIVSLSVAIPIALLNRPIYQVKELGRVQFGQMMVQSDSLTLESQPIIVQKETLGKQSSLRAAFTTFEHLLTFEVLPDFQIYVNVDLDSLLNRALNYEPSVLASALSPDNTLNFSRKELLMFQEQTKQVVSQNFTKDFVLERNVLLNTTQPTALTFVRRDLSVFRQMQYSYNRTNSTLSYSSSLGQVKPLLSQLLNFEVRNLSSSLNQSKGQILTMYGVNNSQSADLSRLSQCRPVTAVLKQCGLDYALRLNAEMNMGQEASIRESSFLSLRFKSAL